MTDLTDILIPLGTGSRYGDIELRYCLRSITKHLSGVGNIWIIGDKPDWLTGVVHVPCQDNPNNWMRANNIYRKIMAGISSVGKLNFYQTENNFVKNEVTVWNEPLSDNFLFMNDDHYLLKGYVAGEFPYYHRGEIDLASMNHNKPQQRQMSNTLDYFEGNANDFDIHCPIVFNKRLFTNLFDRLGRAWPEHGYGVKSFYANHGCDITKPATASDLKFKEPAMKESIYHALEGRQWFSIGDRCLKGAMLEVLEELYPVKSKYEL